MDKPDLELCSNAELIDELLNRETFQGILIFKESDFKGSYRKATWILKGMNLGSRNIAVILDHFSEDCWADANADDDSEPGEIIDGDPESD